MNFKVDYPVCKMQMAVAYSLSGMLFTRSIHDQAPTCNARYPIGFAKLWEVLLCILQECWPTRPRKSLYTQEHQGRTLSFDKMEFVPSSLKLFEKHPVLTGIYGHWRSKDRVNIKFQVVIDSEAMKEITAYSSLLDPRRWSAGYSLLSHCSMIMRETIKVTTSLWLKGFSCLSLEKGWITSWPYKWTPVDQVQSLQ